MLEEEQMLTHKKEQLEHKLQQRNQLREVQAEAARNARSSAGQESTEDLVLQFYHDLEPFVEELKVMLEQTSSMSGQELSSHIDVIVVKLQKLQEFITDAGLFLPPYDVKKSQQTISDLNNKFQSVQEKVKPKKKFGFKSSKQKSAKPSIPDIGNLSVVDSGDSASSKYSNSNSCALSNLTSQTVVLTRDQVNARDVSLDHLSQCKVEIHGSPSTLHISAISNCTILSGPVSTSVMVDGCASSTLAISCQQLRVHKTRGTDIYLHTTAKAIIEDCERVRFAPYSWNYQGLDEDFLISGLDRKMNHWDQVGDFNWLAADRPSPNWSVLPVEERNIDFESK